MKKKYTSNNDTLRLLALFILMPFMGNSQISERLDSLALEYASKGFNGNVLYSKNDSIIFTGNYGFKDYSSKERLNDSTVFELASCSKQFTALAIVQLVEKNLLDYKDKVNAILKYFPYDNITIEHLLRHQSGLPDYQDLLYNRANWNRKKMATNNDVILVLSELNLDLRFEPGSKYEYNNTGYAVLASIIEQVSGRTYGNYVNEKLFIPSGMLTSKVFTIQERPESFQNVARGHTYDERKGNYQKVENDKNHKHIHWMNGILGDRGIYASTLDLEMWKKALRNNTLITADGMKKMTSIDAVSTKYGYGFAIYNTESKGKWVYHNGSWSGYKTMTLYLPDSNEFLLILSNNRFEETYKKFEEDLYKLIQ